MSEVQQSLPWTEPSSGFLALFEPLVIDWLKEASSSVNETSRCKGHDYVTVVADQVQVTVLHVAENREVGSLNPLLREIERQWTGCSTETPPPRRIRPEALV